jgi:hypothetical protein
VDDQQVDDQQVDDQQVDDQQVDDQQVDDQQVDDQQVDDQQVDDQQVDDQRIKKPRRWAGQWGRHWAGSKRAINNLHNICLHIHPTLYELPRNLGSNWGTRSNHRRYLLNHKNKERFYKNNHDERRFLFCFYT